MKITRIKIHNFRSIKDQEIFIGDHNIFVGENNSGKSNLIDAIRYFYDEIKGLDVEDFFNHEDGDLFVEIEFKLTDASKKFFEEKNPKYILKNDNIIVQKFAKNISGKIEEFGRHGFLLKENTFDKDNKFFGFSGVSKSLLADIIYIPPIKKIEDELKTTNQSTTMMKIIKKIIGSKIDGDPDFVQLNESLEKINKKSFFADVEKDLSKRMSGYNCSVEFLFETMDSSDVVSKTQLKLKEGDGTNAMNVSNKGLGTQRALLVNLLQYWAQKEIEEKSKGADNISPTIILIEEPEIFQHPQKQKMLFSELKELSNELSTQVFMNTHSSHFLIQKDSDLLSIFRTYKEKKETIFNQLKEDGATFSLLKLDNDFDFFKWLNGERNQLFFAVNIVLCEGNTEKLLAEYLIREKYKNDYASRSFFTIIDCGGKYKLPHWINLCEELGINFILIYDLDGNKSEKHIKINNEIKTLTDVSKKLIKCYISENDIEVSLFGAKVSKDEKHLIIEKIDKGLANVKVLEEIRAIF